MHAGTQISETQHALWEAILSVPCHLQDLAIRSLESHKQCLLVIVGQIDWTWPSSRDCTVALFPAFSLFLGMMLIADSGT